MQTSPSVSREKRHWWLMNTKVVQKKIREARSLIATQDSNAVAAAVGVLDGALSIFPRHEGALELKARSLLFLRRYKDVADMLQDYIPSYRFYSTGGCAASGDESSSSLSSSDSGRAFGLDGREGATLLPNSEVRWGGSGCFSVYGLRRKFAACLRRSGEREGHWRYLILGQACCHLGLLEDAMILLQTGRSHASEALRRESISRSDDAFLSFPGPIPSIPSANPNRNGGGVPAPSPLIFESASAAHLLAQVKLLLRRRAAATSALDAGHPHEAVRHFSKILESRRGTPHPFAAACLVGRAAAYRDSGRVAEAIADCNRALALNPASIPALCARADLLESVRCFPDCLRDLDHLKLLYDTIIRDRKLPGPAWRPLHCEIRYRDIPSNLRALATRIQGIRQRFAAGEGNAIDYHRLIGIRRGCSLSELDRTHLVLSLRHKPDKAGSFVDRLDFTDEHWDPNTVRDQARMSALILYRLLQKGYMCIVKMIRDEEAAEMARAAAESLAEEQNSVPAKAHEKQQPSLPPAVYQGVFCRDMATVGSILSRVIPVNCEAMIC